MREYFFWKVAIFERKSDFYFLIFDYLKKSICQKFISYVLVQKFLWSFSEMKAFREDIFNLQKISVEIMQFFSIFLSLISPAPRRCDAFGLLQDAWVLLKFLQLKRVLKSLGHQDLPKLPSYVVSCPIGSRRHLPHQQGPKQFCFKKFIGFIGFLCENLGNSFQR